MDDWYSIIAAESELPPDAARQLREIGFVVMPGPEIPGGWARLSQAYDRAVLTADPSDVSIRSSTRVHDFVNRGPEFDGFYVYRPVLAACCRIIGRPFQAQHDACQDAGATRAGAAASRGRQAWSRRVAAGRFHRHGGRV